MQPVPAKMDRIVIVDDHPAVTESVCYMLRRELIEFETTVLPLTGDLEAVLSRLQPRVVIVDWSFDSIEEPIPANTGTDLARRFGPRLPNTKWVLFTGHVRPFVLKEALDAGVLGCVSKACPLKELVAAVRAVADGRCYFCPISQKAFPQIVAEIQLNLQERAILKCIATGKEAKEIAHETGLSVKSIHNYLAKLRSKFGVDSMVALARCAEERGIAPPATRCR